MADVAIDPDEQQRQDDEKNRCVNKLVDICLSLTEHVIRLKELIEASSMERRRLPSLPPYSYTAALVEPFVREIRRRQEQEKEEITMDDVAESDGSEEDCYSMSPPFKRQKLQ